MGEADPGQVLITGTFDVSNYGDLLFPLVAAARLRGTGARLTPVSPTDAAVPYADALRPVPAEAMLTGELGEAGGVLVGGGYILIGRPSALIEEYGSVSRDAYPTLWIGAGLAAALMDAPLLWNAPGAPYPFPTGRRQRLIAPLLASADYLSVRDQQSASLLETDGVEIEVVPDTALDLPRVWPKAELEAEHQALRRRKGVDSATPLLALHVRARALAGVALEDLAAAIDSLAAARGLLPALLCLGASLGDREVVRALSERLRSPHLTLDDSRSLKETASAIACAGGYLGGSLHGYITAAAYGVPGVLLAVPARGKYEGLLAHLDRSGDAARAFGPAFDRAAEAFAAGPPRPLPAGVGEALDRHWARIIACLGRPEPRRAQRLAFLRRYLRAGVEQGGDGWLLGPLLRRRARRAAP